MGLQARHGSARLGLGRVAGRGGGSTRGAGPLALNFNSLASAPASLPLTTAPCFARPACPQADTDREFAAEKFGLKTFPTLVLLPKAGKPGSYVTYPTER